MPPIDGVRNWNVVLLHTLDGLLMTFAKKSSLLMSCGRTVFLMPCERRLARRVKVLVLAACGFSRSRSTVPLLSSYIIVYSIPISAAKVRNFSDICKFICRNRIAGRDFKPIYAGIGRNQPL